MRAHCSAAATPPDAVDARSALDRRDGRAARTDDPDPRLRRAVHAADRAPPARNARLLRDPSVRRRRRLHPRVRAEGHHPVGRAEQRVPKATRRARRTRCGRWACRCSASATACRRWPRSSAARSRPGNVREFGYARGARARPLRAAARHRRIARNAEGHGLLDVWMSHGDKVTAMPPGFKLIGSSRRLRDRRAWPTRRATSTPCSSIRRSRTRSRAPRSSRASRTTSAAAATTGTCTTTSPKRSRDPRAGRRRAK